MPRPRAAHSPRSRSQPPCARDAVRVRVGVRVRVRVRVRIRVRVAVKG